MINKDRWEMNWQGGMGNAIGKDKLEMLLIRIDGKWNCQGGMGNVIGKNKKWEVFLPAGKGEMGRRVHGTSELTSHR